MADEIVIAPVALPAGQFEVRELQKALDSAVSVKDVEQHPERCTKEIVKSIKNPALLARLTDTPVPLGAELIDQEIVYVEGQEPVKSKGIAFTPVDAESGEDAAKMRYYDRREGDETEVTTEPPSPAPSDEAQPTAAALATERLEEEGSSSGSDKKDK